MSDNSLTVRTAAGQKLAGWFASTPCSRMARAVGRILVLMSAAYALAWPESALQIAASLGTAHSYFLPKLAVAWFFIYRWRLVKALAFRFRRKGGTRVEGVPVSELLHHLFTVGHFKRADGLGKFGMAQSRYEALASKLEALGVLVRGQNNARILNPEQTREQVAAILGNGGSADRLKPLLRIFQFGKALSPPLPGFGKKAAMPEIPA